MACKECKKKVVDEDEGYRCMRCDKLYKEAMPSYNFTAKVSDFTETIPV